MKIVSRKPKFYTLIIFTSLILIFVIVNFSSSLILVAKDDSKWKDDLLIKPFITPFRQGCNTTFVMSWDDARPTDVIISEIDTKYGISHTIFAPSYHSYPNQSFWRYSFLLDELFHGFDVQSHNGKHIHLSSYSLKEQEYFIKWGKTGIEELFGFTPIVFAYPYGDTGGSQFVKKYFSLGRTINAAGTSWPPNLWEKEGTTISIHGINNQNLDQIPKILEKIYHTPGFHVFKGYSHSNNPGTDYGVSDFQKYENVIQQIAGWENVWYTSWGELVAYEIEKRHVTISNDIIRNNHSFEFTISTSSNLNTNVYKVPITVAFSLPEGWATPFVQIDNKFTTQFSIQKRKEISMIFLDLIPNKKNQKIKIWKNPPFLDQYPPEIEDFQIKTISHQENWGIDISREKTYSFLRFEAYDTLSEVVEVNATITLFNNTNLYYSNLKNPIFWNNNTYGSVLWNSPNYDSDIQQILKTEIKSSTIIVKDGFGNLRKSIFDFKGRLVETTIELPE
ncbi:MAG: polysaccharide deacetylase family protein [Candidatus Hodarchaeota archaeon]